jgi:Rieske Fe-S protein
MIASGAAAPTRMRRAISGKVVHMKKNASDDVDQGDSSPARPPEGFLAQGVNFAKRFTRDRLTKPDATPVSEIAPGHAKVISVDGDRVAAYRDAEGTLHAVSAICTHRGCVVDWNATEKTWDCPCHGSRYDVDGHVVHGPAPRDLEVKRIEAPAQSRS